MGPRFYAQTGEGGCSRARTTGQGASRSRSFGNSVNPQRGGPTSRCLQSAKEVGPTLGRVGGRPGARPVRGKKQAAAVTLGVAIPALIFAMTKVGALMWIDTHARTA
jgi:hypothetical protein